MAELIGGGGLVALLWGVQPVIYKYVLRDVDPKVILVLSACTYAVCTLALVAATWAPFKRELGRLTAGTAGLIVATSVFTAFLANLLYLYVLSGHDSYVVSALVYSSPVFTVLLAFLFLHERVTALGLGGVALIVSGMLCLAWADKNTEGFFFSLPGPKAAAGHSL